MKKILFIATCLIIVSLCSWCDKEPTGIQNLYDPEVFLARSYKRIESSASINLTIEARHILAKKPLSSFQKKATQWWENIAILSDGLDKIGPIATGILIINSDDFQFVAGIADEKVCFYCSKPLTAYQADLLKKANFKIYNFEDEPGCIIRTIYLPEYIPNYLPVSWVEKNKWQKGIFFYVQKTRHREYEDFFKVVKEFEITRINFEKMMEAAAETLAENGFSLRVVEIFKEE